MDFARVHLLQTGAQSSGGLRRLNIGGNDIELACCRGRVWWSYWRRDQCIDALLGT